MCLHFSNLPFLIQNQLLRLAWHSAKSQMPWVESSDCYLVAREIIPRICLFPSQIEICSFKRGRVYAKCLGFVSRAKVWYSVNIFLICNIETTLPMQPAPFLTYIKVTSSAHPSAAKIWDDKAPGHAWRNGHRSTKASRLYDFFSGLIDVLPTPTLRFILWFNIFVHTEAPKVVKKSKYR